MSNFKEVEKNDKVNLALAKSLRELTKAIQDIKEISRWELKAYALMSQDKYFKESLDYWIANTKHIERQHSKELLKALDSINKRLNTERESNGLLNRIRDKFSR